MKLSGLKRRIQLTQGQFTVVSIEDWHYLTQWKWQAVKPKGGIWYAVRGRKPTIRMHRVILARKLGHEDFAQVDHEDGNGLHNYRTNLRPATKKQNAENRQGPPRNNKSSGIRGVSWYKRRKKWQAQIKHNGKQIHLGYFIDLAKAEQAAIAARNKYFTHHTH